MTNAQSSVEMSQHRPPLSARMGRRLTGAPRSRLARFVLVIVLLLPAMASGIYMWVAWDPSNYLKDIPVALVSEDQGGERDGEQQNIGDQVLSQVSGSGQLDFHVVDTRDDAENGLKENEYLFALVIPEDFTQGILSMAGDDPVKPEVSVLLDDYNGLRGAMVSNSVIDTARQQISATIAKTYADQLVGGVNELGDGLTSAADGSGQLKDGTVTLKDGVGQLKDGVDQLVPGLDTAYDGSGQLKDGADSLVDGTGQLGDGAVRLRDGVGSVVPPVQDMLGQLSGLQQLRPLLEQMAGVGDPSVSEAAQQGLQILGQVDPDGTDGVSAKLTELMDGVNQLADQLSNPEAQYLSGVLRLQDATGQLNDGLGQLADGGHQLKDGSDRLSAGVDTLAGGAGELNQRLSEGAERAPTFADPEGSADMVSEPFTVATENLNPAKTLVGDGSDRSDSVIDRGIAPTIVLIGAFLLSIVTWAVMRPASSRKVEGSALSRAVIPFLRRTWVGITVGIVTAAATAALGTMFGWNPDHKLVMAAVVALIGVTAAATSHFFTAVFGRLIGVMVAFAGLMFQIFVYGGVLPPGTIPPLFRWMEPLAPMTYARDAILRTEVGIFDSTFWTGILALPVFTIAVLVAALLVRYVREKAADEGLVERTTEFDTGVRRPVATVA